MVAVAKKSTTSAAALRAFFNIAKLWKLTVEQQKSLLDLTGESGSTVHHWRNNPDSANLNQDKLDRLSYVLGIYKDLQTLLPDTELADNWVRVPNNAGLFAGRPPIEVMTRGRMMALHQVRQHLAQSRGV